MENNVIRLAGDRANQHRIRNAKWGYSTRRVPGALGRVHIQETIAPKAGDLVLAKVTRLGQHKRIELANGRRARMFVGDDIVVAYGNRYAPDQFEALVPSGLEACHLVAAGGIAAQMVHKHEAVKAPTAIKPVGLLARPNGQILNLADFALPPLEMIPVPPPVIAVVGGSMNAGKTTTAASLVRGLTLAGLTVNAAKVTGTGSGGDIWHLTDAGADRAIDFLDAGHASTYLLAADQVAKIFKSLLANLGRENPDFIVLEVADGLFQSETRELVSSALFQRYVDGVIYASADALGAVEGVRQLRSWGAKVFAVSGVITRSPLGVRETQDALDITLLSRQALMNPVIRPLLADWLHHGESAVLAGGAVQ